MSDMTQEQIRAEFRRQVKLCRGIGRKDMLLAIEEARQEGLFRWERVPSGETTLVEPPSRTEDGLLELIGQDFGLQLFPADEEAVLRAICAGAQEGGRR